MSNSPLRRDRGFASAFREEHTKVRGHWFAAKVPPQQCALTSMVGGIVRHILHQVHQANLRRASRKHFAQGFVGHSIHELGLFFLDFCTLFLYCREVHPD